MTLSPFKHHLLVTGGAGFIGSHVSIFLAETYSNYEIIVVDKLTYCGSKNNLSPVLNLSNFVFIKGDICNLKHIRNIFNTYNIDIVIHIAAETHVDHSFGDALEFTKNNVLGTQNLLECAKERFLNKKFKLFFHTSTDEVYGEQTMNESAKVESDDFKPTNPYSASKACAELLVSTYNKSFKLPTIIIRPNNTYGPKQYPEKLIPKFIYRLDRGLKACVYGTGKNLRCWLYIDDLVEAYDKLLHYILNNNDKTGQVFNVGCDFEYTNIFITKKLIRNIKNIKENENKYIEYVNDRPINDLRYFINSNKINNIWKAKTCFDIGLSKTIKWYLENKNHWNNNKYVNKQILSKEPHKQVRNNNCL